MDKLLYYTGFFLWICVIGASSLYIAGIIYDKYLRYSLLFHWFSVMGGWIMYKKHINTPIYQDIKDAMEKRLKTLQDTNIRKFEQRFLRKYLDNVKIKEKDENWTVFSK